jgi:probable F420-dependent oxidoreductase
MRFGLFGINMGPGVDPAVAGQMARAAEDAGFDSLWAGEHVVLPDPRVPPSPMAPDDPILDPTVALTFAAAHTRTVRLCTGIIILPQRNPLVLAKELASLDVLSGGRLVVGIGVGYLRPEFEALGIPFEGRGPRADEYLRAMLAIWTMDRPELRGRLVSFGGVKALPRPLQRPHPPVVVGGRTPAALRRAARAAGWYGFALDAPQTRACLDGLRAACAEAGRAFDELEISVTPDTRTPTVDEARGYADLGVHRLVLNPRPRTEAELAVELVRVGRDLVGRV